MHDDGHGPWSLAQRGLVVAHVQYAVVLLALGAWVAIVLGADDPNDDWMIRARMVAWPVAAVIGGVAVGVLATTAMWARSASRAPVFLADMIIPVSVFLVTGPLILAPSLHTVPTVLVLVSGGFVAGVRSPAAV
jgi:hypothetical protein